jgi:hypothetical protein
MPPPDAVQEKHSLATSGTSLTCTFDGSVTAGNIVAYCVWFESASRSISSTSDDRGGGTHENPGDHPISGSGYHMYDRYFHVGTTGSCTITVNFDAALAGTLAYIIAQEISGCAASNALEAHDGNAQDSPVSTSTDAITSTAQTTTINGCYIMGVTLRVGAGTLSAGTNFTNDYTGGEPLMIEHLVQASAGSIAATYTISDANATVTTIMMVFKPLVAVSAGPSLQVLAQPLRW